MSETLHIPKILREREGPSLRERASDFSHEFISERRKKISKEMARILLDITFNKGSIEIEPFDPDNPDKYEQDVAFATYEDNLRETHRKKMKSIGSTVMVLSGLDLAAGVMADKRGSRNRQKARRKAYVQRNGTVKSHLRDRYIARMQK